MDLGATKVISINTKVQRVVGGWIYTTQQGEAYDSPISSVFVTYDEMYADVLPFR